MSREGSSRDLFAQDRFLAHVREELGRRVRSNPRYSLRAMARDLHVDFSTLSKYLRGRRRLGFKSLLKMGNALGLSALEIQSLSSPSRYVPSYDVNGETKIPPALSDWYFMAILEAVHLGQPSPSISWIANLLDISQGEARCAVDRLAQWELLRFAPNGEWKIDYERVQEVLGGQPHYRLTERGERQVISSLLKMGGTRDRDSLQRESMVVATDAERIKRAKEMIRQVQIQLIDLLKSSPKPTELYCLSVLLFPLGPKKK